MIKFIQALLTSIFFIMIIDFFLFLGMKFYYLDFYEIPEFFNPFFWDNQSYYVLIPSITLLTFIFFFIKKIKTVAYTLIATAVLLSISSTFINSLGFLVGKIVLIQENVVVKDDRYTYKGDIYFEGRHKIWFFDKETEKVFELKKSDITKIK